jgi:hypothetical protein
MDLQLRVQNHQLEPVPLVDEVRLSVVGEDELLEEEREVTIPVSPMAGDGDLVMGAERVRQMQGLESEGTLDCWKSEGPVELGEVCP